MTEDQRIYEPVLALETIVRLLESVNVPYFLVGSFASGIRGEFRATNDIDLVCKFTDETIISFLSSAAADFFCDEVAIPLAVRDSRSFNIIHRETFIKVDCFTRLGPFEIDQFEHATAVQIPRSQRTVRVATAEHNILAKLCWYQKSNRVLERQVRDVKSMLEVNKGMLDLAYLSYWAEQLNITDLLYEMFNAVDYPR